MSLVSSHLTAIYEHAAGLIGGEVGVMRPHDAEFVSISEAIVGNERTEPRENGDGGVDLIKIRDVVAPIASIPGAVERIDLLWEIDGNRYATEDTTRIDGGYCLFKLRRAERHEIARKGYRGEA